jgi:hypothetical protein
MSLANERTPTLGNVILHWECFMMALEEYGTHLPCLKPILDEGLAWATTYYSRMDNTKAYIIAMCESPAYTLFTILILFY